MKLLLLVSLFSIVLAQKYKKEALKCHLKPGDSVEMTGDFTSTTGKAGMALALRSAKTMPFRVEVFPGLKSFILRSGTAGQWPPKLVKMGSYSGAKNLKVRVAVGPRNNYQVWINDQNVGMIPNIGGPAPTHIETNHQFDTKSLQVFSSCAVNPAKTTQSSGSSMSTASGTQTTTATTSATATSTATASTASPTASATGTPTTKAP